MSHEVLTKSSSKAGVTAAKRRETCVTMVGSLKSGPSVSYLLVFTPSVILAPCVQVGVVGVYNKIWKSNGTSLVSFEIRMQRDYDFCLGHPFSFLLACSEGSQLPCCELLLERPTWHEVCLWPTASENLGLSSSCVSGFGSGSFASEDLR